MATTEVNLQNQETEEEVDELEDALSKATEGDIDGIEAEGEGEEKPVEKPEEKPEEKPADESRELKQVIRQQAKDLAIMRARLERMEKKSVVSKKTDSEDVDDLFKKDEETIDKIKKEDDLDKLSNIELLEGAINNLGETKGPALETLLETMEQNSQYTDIREVCSQSHFNDIFDAVGKAVSEKHGVDPIEAALEFELSVWNRPNPYKYMYEVIKQYHSDYVKEEDDAGKTKEKVSTPAKAPSSLANLPGGDAGTKTGWTAERIDNLAEDELDKVPQDVYDKYLAGELD